MHCHRCNGRGHRPCHSTTLVPGPAGVPRPTGRCWPASRLGGNGPQGTVALTGRENAQRFRVRPRHSQRARHCARKAKPDGPSDRKTGTSPAARAIGRRASARSGADLCHPFAGGQSRRTARTRPGADTGLPPSAQERPFRTVVVTAPANDARRTARPGNPRLSDQNDVSIRQVAGVPLQHPPNQTSPSPGRTA